MKCSVCKNCSAHLTKIGKKLFCNQCKPGPMKLEFEVAPIKQEIDPEFYNSYNSSSSSFNLQKKLKKEINLQEDDETVNSDDHSLDMSYNSVETDDNSGTSDTSWSIPTAASSRAKKKHKIANKNHKAKRQRKCSLCYYSCNTIYSMRNHLRKFHPEFYSARCKICYREFNGASNYDRHINEEHDGFGAQCKVCLEKFKRGQRLAHQRECKGRHLFGCASCEKRYLTLESLRKHLDEHGVAESKKYLSIVETRTTSRLFICVICEEDLVYYKETYWKHVKEQHNGHFLRCDDCGKTYKDSRSWLNHRKTFCNVEPAQDQLIAQEMLCPHCSKSCKDKTSLFNHMYKNHRENPYICNKCGMKFQTSGAHRHHRDTAHSEPHIECTKCSRKFYTKTSLKRHKCCRKKLAKPKK